MNIRVNGECQEIKSGLPLTGLLRELQIQGRGIAVELNRKVVEKESWEATILRDGDSIEIVQAVGGG